MSDFARNFRHALRQVRTHKAHSAIVITTLGLALGLATLIFAFVSFFLLRPLPMKDESTMVLARTNHPQQEGARPRMSYPDFVDFRAQSKTVEELVALWIGTGALSGQGDAKRVSVAGATEGLFRVWDIPMIHGRRFLPAEDAVGGTPVLMLSHGFWNREFGADASVVGRTLIVDGRPGTVIGVVDPTIEIGRFSEIDVWIPLEQSNPSTDRARRDLMVSGRRANGVSVAQVSAEFATIAERIAVEHPGSNKDWTASAQPIRDGLYGQGTEVILALLVVGVCLVFAVACANVAGIMLARATAREREMALRLTLGADKGRIVRQLVTEGAVLAFLGAALGLAIAQGGILLMRSVAFEQFYDLVRIDLRVLAFAIALALMAPLLFAVAPALRLVGRELAGVLRDGGSGGGTSVRVGRSRRALVATQIALATSLLVLSGLALRSAMTLNTLDVGYQTTDLLTARIDFAESRHENMDAVRERVERLRAVLGSTGGVTSAAAASEIPTFDRTRTVNFEIEGQADAKPIVALLTTASSNYFETLGIPMVSGRAIGEGDRTNAVPVAVVSRGLAMRAFGGTENAIGRRIRLGNEGAPWLEVVGLSADLRTGNINQPPAPHIYVPFAQSPERSMVLFARTKDPATALRVLREAMRSIDPEQPLYDAKTVAQVAWEDLDGNRIITGLFGALGAVALGLATVGLYGLTAFLVAQRSREIGVRMALGASARDVIRLIVRQGAAISAIGLGVGLAIGAGLGMAMSSILFGVSAGDPATLGGTAIVLGTAVFLAHWAPARRAVGVNPIEALRQD